MSEERRGPGGPPRLGSLRRERRQTSLKLLSLPSSERPRGLRRSSSLKFLPTTSTTLVDPNHHRWIGQVDKGDALILSVPPHCAKSWPCIQLFSRTTSLPHSPYHVRGMEATPPQDPDLSRRQKGPMIRPHIRTPQVQGTL